MIGLRFAAGVALASTIALGGWLAYRSGVEDGRARSDAKLVQAKLVAEQARNDALARLADANAQVVKIQAEAAARIAAIQKRTPARVQTVERIIHENPGFAGAVRPADVERVRDEQFAELIEAAARSADLSGRILPGVRSADPVVGQNPGGDGNDRR